MPLCVFCKEYCAYSGLPGKGCDHDQVSSRARTKAPEQKHPLGSTGTVGYVTLPRKALTALYNAGYGNGHNDTVESCYTDVLPVDAETYHEDIVAEWLEDYLGT